jgi:hypothetical protein
MEIWQRFTSTARRAILLAHSEAARSHAQLIGTEHLLLGLLRLGEGAASETLVRVGVDVEGLAADLQDQLGPGVYLDPSPEVSFTPHAQQVLSYSYNEAQQMNDSHVGTEHILLGLLRLGEGPAYQLLRQHGAELATVRQAVVDINGAASQQPAGEGLGPQDDGYQAFYDLERYLFETVRPRFAREGSLGAFDFFCIVIWKAERAKSLVARRLLASPGVTDLESAVRRLTAALAEQLDARARLRHLLSAGLRLPLASAILTVLYPLEFTVYDQRVCGQLPDGEALRRLGNQRRFDAVWEGYRAYVDAVRQAAPERFSLRDRDRYVWGKAFYEQLTGEIEKGFARGE